MLIDFKELSKLLPESGSLSMSIKKGKGEKLDVLFRVKHELAQLKNASSRGSDEAKQIDAATKLLDQPYAFSATAEELNASFEEKIKQPVESTRSLVEVITDRTKALEEAAKSIRTSSAKAKTTDKAKATGTAEATTKTAEKPSKQEPNIGSLFGSVGTNDAKAENSGKSEIKSGKPAPSVEEDTVEEPETDDSQPEDEASEDDLEEEKEAA